MNKYLPRIVDDIVENKLSYMGALLIEGCKWCGKSTTAKNHANSVLEFQNPDKKNDYDKKGDCQWTNGSADLQESQW